MQVSFYCPRRVVFDESFFPVEGEIKVWIADLSSIG